MEDTRSWPFDGFVGPSYQLQNKFAAVERTVNWFMEANESPTEQKWKFDLMPLPGNAPFGTLPVPAGFNKPNRGLIEYRGHVYGVNGDTPFTIDKNGVYTKLMQPDGVTQAFVVNDGLPVSMVGNGTGQIFVASGGEGYVIQVGPNTVTGGFPGFLGASMATFQDGYIIVLTPNSNQYQISGTDATPLGDATKWSVANVSIQAGQGDLLRALISSREYLRLFGTRRIQVHHDVGARGAGLFPFENYNEIFIETGIAAALSLADLGESLVWIGEDARGQRACWRDVSFRPERISTFAVERFWQSYPRVDDAVAFAFIWLGHLFYQITFPSANPVPGGGPPLGATWLYDATVSSLIEKPIWTERSFTNALNFQIARSELFHCYAFGKHLVGSGGADGNPGAVYQYSGTQYTDSGTDAAGAQSQQPIVRDRIAPHLWSAFKRIVYNRIEFEVARGVGLDGVGQGTNPTIMLRWSNDAGSTFGPEQEIPVGKIGQYLTRVHYDRVRYGRDRVFWLRASDPVFWGVVGAWLDFIVCGS